jgi:hypothetical protein
MKQAEKIKLEFFELLTALLEQAPIPAPMKLIASRQLNQKIKTLTDDQVPQMVELALRFCVSGLVKFCGMLDFKFAVVILSDQGTVYHNNNLGAALRIEAHSDTASSNGQSHVPGPNRERQNDTGALSTGTA